MEPGLNLSNLSLHKLFTDVFKIKIISKENTGGFPWYFYFRDIDKIPIARYCFWGKIIFESQAIKYQIYITVSL